ncbi:MarR family transcriptional regulator [Cytobacillus oceanisediminis]|uniref:MarR family transcriptional regulator n=1 Tax=Niallia alba TaxID=2729105 RepID=A0A7Y0K8Q8_9BACI|nr:MULTISPECIES: MarR family transcriptional regulator [Bacillaceae]EOR22841.1 MarR family transcriptional regulator [Niallia nealsonii AAU1]MBQ6446192.1 MarR family transcriptional regulator [Bacillus sp. (in: firmicutes)]MBZ9535127.1 MarR family transcriptional regulator [Cytobacillus oceanisediminis]MED3791516.1 MarR family transcriptional regulator [Niallia alba]NMO77756.1 MarR family transcriptional regulator [Niallia alba]
MRNGEELFEVAAMFGTFIKNITSEFNKNSNDLNITQYKLLFHLDKEGAQNVSDLAKSVHITNAAVTSITDQLLADDYITKVRSQSDRRVVNITITEKGRNIVNNMKKEQQNKMKEHFRKLTEEDIQHLKRIFTLLNENF